jgi:hypothetical protein
VIREVRRYPPGAGTMEEKRLWGRTCFPLYLKGRGHDVELRMNGWAPICEHLMFSLAALRLALDQY